MTAADQAGVRIEALRARGAERFDAAGLRFIEALARRAAAHGGEAARILERRLDVALGEYAERLDSAACEAADALAHATVRFPEAADALRALHEAGDFGGLHRLVAGLAARGGGSPLAELLDHIRRHAPEGMAGGEFQPRGELKSLHYFRRTWTKLGVDRQLSHAFAQAPENAGPLNSHFLALQALKQMRELAPAYLEQFVSYVDTLLWLDQVEGSRSPAQKGGERGRKRKAGRGSAAA